MKIQSINIMQNNNRSSYAAKKHNNVQFGSSGISAQAAAREKLNLLIKNDMTKNAPFIKEIKEDFAQKWVSLLTGDKPFVVSVAGRQASGKTTFSEILCNSAKANNSRATLINDDDYFTDISKKIQEMGGLDKLLESGYSLDAPYHMNLPLLKFHLQRLKLGEAIYAPKYDFVNSTSEFHVNIKTPSTMIVHEGLFALNDTFDNVADIKLYCEADNNICKDRWYNRTESRGVKGRTADLHYADIMKSAQKYIEPDRQKADVVLNTGTPIGYIKQFVKEMCSL